MATDITLILIAYLAGSIASAVLVCRLLGLDDPRLAGSGNPGATNVLRLHGKIPGLLALSGDLIKGIFPVLLAGAAGSAATVIALSGLAAFLGHLFPVFFRFHGGKGVATLLGVLIGFHWLLGALFVASWLVVAGVSRYSSVAGISAALLAPVYAWWLMPEYVYAACLAVMAVLLVWRHHPNITRLIAGNESRISFRR